MTNTDAQAIIASAEARMSLPADPKGLHHSRFMATITSPRVETTTRDQRLYKGITGSERMIAYQGTIQSLSALCRASGKLYATVVDRIERGISLEDALALPIRNGGKGKP